MTPNQHREVPGVTPDRPLSTALHRSLSPRGHEGGVEMESFPREPPVTLPGGRVVYGWRTDRSLGAPDESSRCVVFFHGKESNTSRIRTRNWRRKDRKMHRLIKMYPSNKRANNDLYTVGVDGLNRTSHDKLMQANHKKKI